MNKTVNISLIINAFCEGKGVKTNVWLSKNNKDLVGLENLDNNEIESILLSLLRVAHDLQQTKVDNSILNAPDDIDENINNIKDLLN